jgi:7-cyano-7-deazaguanine reductase
MSELDNSRINKHLGQTSEYKDQYDKTLLVNEPRSNNRTHLGIEDTDLPFIGYDTWNAYEVSGLTNNGLPAAGVAKIVYPCSSKYIVESKSIKLYFNSYNMYKFGETPIDVLNNIAKQSMEDLSELLETDVKVYIHPANVRDTGDPVMGINTYTTLEQGISQERLGEMKVDIYQETPEVLSVTRHEDDQVSRYHSSLLKSNCRVTSQPDWGDVYIMYKGMRDVTMESMLKYIVSFRDECHFHEEICETIYKRLCDILNPTELVVTCLYARRGGIDINPVRASSLNALRECGDLINPSALHTKTAKQ